MTMVSTQPFGINGRFYTQPVTGVQRYARNVTQALDEIVARDGLQARLLVPHGCPDPGLAAIPAVPVGRWGGHAWEQFELARTHPGWLINLCNTAPALKRNQIVCIHDANVFLSPESYSRAFRTVYRTLQPLLARRSAKITAVSRFSAEQIARYLPLRASEIAVLPNGHEHVHAWDASKAEIAPAALDRIVGQNNRPFLLALGSSARHKNIGMLLNLAPDLASLGVDLVIAGGRADIFAPVEGRRDPNVHHLGFVSDHDLAYLLDRALCLVFPSLTEGFGLPALEAMAWGCPVISTDRASLPEICGQAALMAAPDQPTAWLAHIRALLGSPDLRQTLIGRGRQQAKLYSWRESAQGYIDLLGQPAT